MPQAAAGHACKTEHRESMSHQKLAAIFFYIIIHTVTAQHDLH